MTKTLIVKGSKLEASESYALLAITNVIGLEACARSCDVAPGTLARGIARCPMYERQKQRIRAYLAKQQQQAS